MIAGLYVQICLLLEFPTEIVSLYKTENSLQSQCQKMLFERDQYFQLPYEIVT